MEGGKTIHVSGGKWEDARNDPYSPPDFFRIVSVSYGDLNGNGQDEAVVLGACGGARNWQDGDIFIFSMGPGGPRLLAELSPSDWGKGEQDNGGDFQVSSVRIVNGQLAVCFFAGGSHAIPAWTVTAKFQWNGTHFVRVGLDRVRYKSQ